MDENSAMAERLAKNQEIFSRTHDRLGAIAHHDAVFGTPIVKNDFIVIPAAEVTAAMGFGFGMGLDEGKEPKGGGIGGGGGAGGTAAGRPVAAIVIETDGVRIEPIVDVTKVALASFAALGAMFFALSRMRLASRGTQTRLGRFAPLRYARQE